MTIAIVTSPESAISSLTDLVEEVRDELDDDGFDLQRIYRAITRAEARFNRAPGRGSMGGIRAPKMETSHQFTTTTEETELPADFLEMRTAYEENSPDNPLSAMSPASLRRLYRGVTGLPTAYAIENRRFVMAPIGEATFTILYYAKIPALTDGTPSNWLLEEHPDVYVHQVLAILFNKIGNSEAAANNLAAADAIIDSINDTGKASRWSGGPLTPRGFNQVCGARR